MLFSIDWLDDAPNAAEEEAATACDLQIFIGDTNVAKHLDEVSNSVEDHVSLPAYSIAMGLACDWWHIFGGRRRDYRLFRHRMGYAFPDVRLRFDGLIFESWAEQKALENPKLRFWVGPPEVVDRAEGERSLSDFVSAVVRRLGNSGPSSAGLTQQWDQVLQSRADADESTFCEAAGALGKDPYSISDADASLIEQAGGLFDGEPLLEFLAGISAESTAIPAMQWIDRVEKGKDYRSKFPELGRIASEVASSAPHRIREQSWSLGYRRARALRRTLGISKSEIFPTVLPLAKRLGSNSFSFSPWVEGVHALVTTHGADEANIFLRDRPSTANARRSHLFSFGRAVGDAICFPQTRRAVVNDLHDAARQSASRAFAAEFLAPIDEILSMKESGRDNESVAEHFGVSSAVIDHQIENQLRITTVCA